MSDKDIAGIVEPLREVIDVWHVATLATPRAATADHLAQTLQDVGVKGRVHIYPSIEEAFNSARSNAGENDRIAAFGSFYTVAPVLALKPR
jgi:dihydrofolate synthase/folylpolyglutamate synthase